MGASSDGSMGTGTGGDPALQGDDIDAGGGWNPGNPNATSNSLTPQQQMLLKMMGKAIGQSAKPSSVQPGNSMGSPWQNGNQLIQTMAGGQQIGGNPVQR